MGWGLSAMRAAIHRPHDLPGVVAGVPGRAVHPHLATLAIGMGAEQTAPMAHLAKPPSLGFGVANGILDILSGVTRPGHVRPLKMRMA